MKEATSYFSHDFGARNDPKLIKVQMEMGGLGLAIWWCLVEMLWEQDGYLPREYKSIAFCLRWATEEDVRRVIEDFGLFEMDEMRCWNNSALRRIEKRNSVSQVRRDARSRANKSQSNENHLLDKCQSTEPQINKYINKQIDSSSCVRTHARGEEEQEQKEHIFQIFFFKNMTRPGYEVDRFWDYYQARGWKWGDQEIEDIDAVARQWTPEKDSARFPARFLDWIEKVFQRAIEERVSWNPVEMLKNIDKAVENVEGYDFRFWMLTKVGAITVMTFVQRQGLDEGLKIDYRFRK